MPPLGPGDLVELADIAIAAATDAAAMIATSRPAAISRKADAASPAAEVVTEIDRHSESIILEHLAPTVERFALGLLTEERDDDGSRLTADHFWSIDPLDGTLPFIEGAAGSAVSIALVARDGTPLIGVVHDLDGGTRWHAIAGQGAYRNGSRWEPGSPPLNGVLSVFADRSFLTRADHDVFMARIERVALDLGLRGADLHVGAGAVINACSVLLHPPACYLKPPAPSGGGSLWDFAATACLFDELGAVATDLHGSPLDLNRPDSTFMHHRGVLFTSSEPLAAALRRQMS